MLKIMDTMVPKKNQGLLQQKRGIALEHKKHPKGCRFTIKYFYKILIIKRLNTNK